MCTRTTRTVWIASAITYVHAMPLPADELHVPGQCPRLQGASDAAYNGDGVVDTGDLVMLLGVWVFGEPIADWNGEGTIESAVPLAFLDDWVEGC